MKRNELRIADCGLRIGGTERASRESGFTLLEIVMVIVLVGVFMAAIAVPFVSGIRESDLPEIVATADFLAVEELERTVGLAYASLATGPVENPVSGFTGYSRQLLVANVDANLNPSVPDVGYKTVTVTVWHNELPASGISLMTLRADY